MAYEATALHKASLSQSMRSTATKESLQKGATKFELLSADDPTIFDVCTVSS